MKNKWIILDRDGVINYDSDDYIKSPEEWRPIPNSLAAIVKLNRAGFKIVIATNQSGVGRGLYTEATLQLIHQKMIDNLTALGGHLEGIFYCPHKPEDNCDCRKPKPGLFTAIAKQYHINLTGIPAIGDSLRDLQAAKTAGCTPILVLTGNGETTSTQIKTDPALAQTKIYRDLNAAVDALIGS